MPSKEHHEWFKFADTAPDGVRVIRVQVAAEDTDAAEKYARKVLTPRLAQRTAIALDFGGWTALTQSYAHSLLYEAVRLAWALKQPIYILNARPGVQSALRFLETYALAG